MRILALNRRVSRRASENQAVRAALAAYLTLTLLLAVYLALPGVEDLNRPVLAACALTTLVWTMSNFVVAPVGPRAEPMFAIGTVVALVVIPVAIAASGASQSPLRALMLPLIVFWAWFYGARRALMAIAVVMTVHLAPLAYDPDAFTGAGLGWTLTLTATFAICGGTMVVARRALARLRDAARAEALRDPLTNLANRRSLMSFLQRRSTRRRGGDGALGLIMIDLDGFKAFNTLHGHAGGDAALIAVARALRHTMRDPDPPGLVATSSRSPSPTRTRPACASPPSARLRRSLVRAPSSGWRARTSARAPASRSSRRTLTTRSRC